MASAQRVFAIEERVQEVEVLKGVVLNLGVAEAKVLRRILARVGGEPGEDFGRICYARGHAERIYRALGDVGISAAISQRDVHITGEVHLYPCPVNDEV